MEDFKKSNRRREPSYNSRFILIAATVLLAVVAVVITAKFATIKALFWLE